MPAGNARSWLDIGRRIRQFAMTKRGLLPHMMGDLDERAREPRRFEARQHQLLRGHNADASAGSSAQHAHGVVIPSMRPPPRPMSPEHGSVPPWARDSNMPLGMRSSRASSIVSTRTRTSVNTVLDDSRSINLVIGGQNFRIGRDGATLAISSSEELPRYSRDDLSSAGVSEGLTSSSFRSSSRDSYFGGFSDGLSSPPPYQSQRSSSAGSRGSSSSREHSPRQHSPRPMATVREESSPTVRSGRLSSSYGGAGQAAEFTPTSEIERPWGDVPPSSLESQSTGGSSTIRPDHYYAHDSDASGRQGDSAARMAVNIGRSPTEPESPISLPAEIDGDLSAGRATPSHTADSWTGEEDTLPFPKLSAESGLTTPTESLPPSPVTVRGVSRSLTRLSRMSELEMHGTIPMSNFSPALNQDPYVDEDYDGTHRPPPMDTEDDISIHYTRLMRTIDKTHRKELHGRDVELSKMRERLNDVDRAYRQVLKVRDQEIQELHERILALEDIKQDTIDKARNKVEDMWESRWKDRDRHMLERMRKLELEGQAGIGKAVAQRDEEWTAEWERKQKGLLERLRIAEEAAAAGVRGL